MPRERRQFSRVDFESTVILQVPDKQYQAELLDISLRGALVNMHEENPLEKDRSCIFELRLDRDSAIVRMDACIVYVKERMLGLRFENPDLESITHLRRLVELNTGDSTLVRNELFFLVGSKPE